MHFEKYLSGLAVAAALLGLLGVEYLYFTNAAEVRLLFVLLLAPVGAALGLAALYLLFLVAGISAVAAVVGIVLAAVGGVVYLLYSIIVWTN